jgi:hypothetical protein
LLSHPLHNRAFASIRWLVRILGLLNLSDDQIKCLGDIIVESSTGLGPTTAEFFG